MSRQVVVVDYGIGNVFSVCNALARIGASPILSSTPAIIAKADRVILPGVGAFSKAMDKLRSDGLHDAITTFVDTGRPLLGICLGMQMLMERSSEFGDHTGLAYIEGAVEQISTNSASGNKVKVPHIGWAKLKVCSNVLHVTDKKFPLASGSYFYFVHSFACKPNNHNNILATVSYHCNEINAIIGRDNVLGVQFHPERSGPAGLSFLSQFMTGNLLLMTSSH